MSVTYEFKDLNALADYFATKAAESRAFARSGTKTPTERKKWMQEGYAYEQAAYVVRNTTLTDESKQ